MTNMRTIFAGWTLAFVAVGFAASAFPAIAQKAADRREAVQWQSRAQNFKAIDTGDVAISDLATRLTEQHISVQNPLLRDAMLISDIMNDTNALKQRATFEAQEKRCLSEAVYYEARSETLSGQKAVAEVVLNRVNSKHFPSTICAVVYQGAERTTGCQFSFTCDGSTLIEPRGRAWIQSQDIAALVITKGVHPITRRATHYHTHEVNPVWSGNLKMTARVGSHVFYRFAPRKRKITAPELRVAPPS